MKYKKINKDTKFDAVILASGDSPKSELALEILRKTKPLIICDSAMKTVENINNNPDAIGLNSVTGLELHPSAIVGDGDSLPSELKKKYADIYHEYSEQEYNDLTKATKFAIEHYNSKTIAYIGATGKREDHTISNISLMAWYMDNLGIQPYMITDYDCLFPAKGFNTFECIEDQEVSIFNKSCSRLEGTGLKWNPYPYTELWQGSLNETLSTEFTLNGDGTYLVFFTFHKKKRAK